MALTVAQKANHAGFPKAGELIEITGAHALEASDRALLNALFQHAHESGRLATPGATWEVSMTALRPSAHESNDRLRESLSRLLSVQVNVAYRDAVTARDMVLQTHLTNRTAAPSGSACRTRCARSWRNRVGGDGSRPKSSAP